MLELQDGLCSMEQVSGVSELARWFVGCLVSYFFIFIQKRDDLQIPSVGDTSGTVSICTAKIIQ